MVKFSLALFLITFSSSPSSACEIQAWGVDSHQRGNFYAYDSSQPGAFRVPGGRLSPAPRNLQGEVEEPGNFPAQHHVLSLTG